MKRLAKRILNRWRGHGPNRIVAFNRIERDRTHCEAGVHRAEDFTGIIATAVRQPAEYRPGLALLGQEETWEGLCNGPRYRTEGLAPASTPKAYVLTDAGVITADGIVYCRRTRRAVTETVRQWTSAPSDHPVFSAPGYPPAAYLPGLALNLATLSGEGFYHFLLEAIPRLQLARPWLARADHVLANGAPGGFHEQWLVHAGVPREKIYWMRGLCHVACRQVIFTDPPMGDQQPAAQDLHAIRAAFPAPAPARTGRRLWISRNDAAARRLNWEDALLDRLPGFERVVLSGFSPSEQIALAAGADVIAGPHGAGLSHVLFAREGARLIELFPHARRQPIYSRLCNLAGVKYAWAVTDFASPRDLAPLADAMQVFAAGAAFRP